MNSPAQKAAGAIHSDFEKKFIRAEVVNWQALIDHTAIRACARKACCAWKAKSTLSRTGTCL